MTENKLVDINTGQPVKSIEKESTGGVRKALMQDGKRWQKFKELHEQGGFTMSTLSGDFDFDQIVGSLDALIGDDVKEKKHQEYLKYKTKKKD